MVTFYDEKRTKSIRAHPQDRFDDHLWSRYAWRMRVLLHICCGPCACYCVESLRDEGFDPTGYWFNPNIHPYREYLKRLDTLKDYVQQVRLPLVEREDYALENWMRSMVFREDQRCTFCYYLRLTETAKEAKARDFETFSTTLLYSKYQKHEQIIAIAQQVAQEQGVPFLYRDFRSGWTDGIARSKELGLYRQPYCGCIYSEKERYQKKNSKPASR